MSQCHQYISNSSAFHQRFPLVNVWTFAFCCQRVRTCPHIPEHQTENIKLIFHRAPTPIRQIYVDIPSINGWKIDRIWCPRVEHEAAGGSVDTSAIFGRSPVLSFNLVRQATDALLHASVWSGKMESRRAQCHGNVPSLPPSVIKIIIIHSSYVSDIALSINMYSLDCQSVSIQFIIAVKE